MSMSSNSGSRRWLNNFCRTIPLIYYSNQLWMSKFKWVVYNKRNYCKIHHDKVSDVIVLRVNSQENTFTRVLMHKWVLDKVELEQVHNREIQANFAESPNDLSEALVQESTRISSQETIKKL